MLNDIMTLKSGLLNVIQFQTGTIRKLGCGFLFAFPSIVTMALSCIIY